MLYCITHLRKIVYVFFTKICLLRRNEPRSTKRYLIVFNLQNGVGPITFFYCGKTHTGNPFTATQFKKSTSTFIRDVKGIFMVVESNRVSILCTYKIINKLSELSESVISLYSFAFGKVRLYSTGILLFSCLYVSW